jgi:hypothetical protein
LPDHLPKNWYILPEENLTKKIWQDAQGLILDPIPGQSIEEYLTWARTAHEHKLPVFYSTHLRNVFQNLATSNFLENAKKNLTPEKLEKLAQQFSELEFFGYREFFQWRSEATQDWTQSLVRSYRQHSLNLKN